jgi:hypothetical protein
MASNNSDPAPLKRGVEVSNKLDNDTTTIRVVYTHRPGLHADLAVCVDGQKFLRILRSEVTRHGHLRVHRFWVVDVVTHKKLPHALLTPLSLSVRDAVVDPGIWARWFGVENAKRRAAIDHENENRGDKGVGATLTIPVDAVPSALRDLALCALAKGVDFDELRSGVPRQSHDGHLQFHVEVSLRCGDGDDAGLGTRCAFPKSNDCVPILVLRRDYYLCRSSARNYSYTLRKTDTLFYPSLSGACVGNAHTPQRLGANRFAANGGRRAPETANRRLACPETPNRDVSTRRRPTPQTGDVPDAREIRQRHDESFDQYLPIHPGPRLASASGINRRPEPVPNRGDFGTRRQRSPHVPRPRACVPRPGIPGAVPNQVEHV